jgi:hypothetical protein
MVATITARAQLGPGKVMAKTFLVITKKGLDMATGSVL